MTQRTPLSSDSKQRSKEKAELHRDNSPPTGTSWSRDNITVTLNSVPTVRDGVLEVDDVVVEVDGEQKDVTKTLPWRFVNPPLMNVYYESDNNTRQLYEDPPNVLGEILLDTAKRVVG